MDLGERLTSSINVFASHAGLLVDLESDGAVPVLLTEVGGGNGHSVEDS